jgi:hypothetical protein
MLIPENRQEVLNAMKIRTCSINKYVLAFFVLCMMTVFSFNPFRESAAEAAVYTNMEKIYLKDITPILYELSEVGKSVSAKAVVLQNSPADVCSEKFGYYQGIVESMRVRLNSIPAPPRMVNIQSTALLAIGDYISGLNIYAKSCTEEDYHTKAKMGFDARQRIIEADQKLREVNELIINPWRPRAAKYERAPQVNKIQQMCASTWPADERMQDYCVKNQSEALTRLSKMTVKYPKGSRERQVMESCSATWKKGDSYDYRMIIFCVENVLGKQAIPQ